MLTLGGSLTDSSAGLVVEVPDCLNLDLDTVCGPEVQVSQNYPVLEYVFDSFGLWEATEMW